MKNLKKLRTSRHLSQFKLAELFHISQQSVWKYENDLAQPDLELIIAFANFSIHLLIILWEIRIIQESMKPCLKQS